MFLHTYMALLLTAVPPWSQAGSPSVIQCMKKKLKNSQHSWLFGEISKRDTKAQSDVVETYMHCSKCKQPV